MTFKKIALGAAAASLAATPIVASAAVAERSAEPVESANELNGNGIGPAIIITLIAVAGMAALLIADDDDVEPISP